MTWTKSLKSLKATPTADGADLVLVWERTGPVPVGVDMVDGESVIRYQDRTFTERQTMSAVPWETVHTMIRVWHVDDV